MSEVRITAEDIGMSLVDIRMPQQAIERRTENDWPMVYHVVVLRPDQIDLIAEAVARKLSALPAPPKEVGQ